MKLFDQLNPISRSSFVKFIGSSILNLIAFISFPFANINLKSDKSNIMKISKLPETGPWPTSDPFLFCVHHNDNYPKANNEMGPESPLDYRNIGNDFSNLDGWSMYHGDKIPGFPRHPHRGFETITIVDKGIIDHADSMGYSARYGDGDVQWLTAGDGIQHSEMFPLLNKEDFNPIDFFQIWINLKSENKRVNPNFSMFWKEQIPKVIEYNQDKNKIEIEIIAGAYKNHIAPNPPPNSWANEKSNSVNIWKITLDEKAKFILPEVEKGISRNIYFYYGNQICINGENIDSNSMIEFQKNNSIEILSKKGLNKILLLQAKPINEPIARYGPFVMNTKEEIQIAFNDYKKTRFGNWKWDDDGPVHGAKYKKFSIGNN